VEDLRRGLVDRREHVTAAAVREARDLVRVRVRVGASPNPNPGCSRRGARGRPTFFMITCAAKASRPEVGSSRKMSMGRITSSMPIEVRFFSPPEIPRVRVGVGVSVLGLGLGLGLGSGLGLVAARDTADHLVSDESVGAVHQAEIIEHLLH
jgi:hypothetical protein